MEEGQGAKSTGCGKSMSLPTRELNKVWRAIKRNGQHAKSPKTKAMFSRTTFVVQTFLIASKLHTTVDNSNTTCLNRAVKRSIAQSSISTQVAKNLHLKLTSSGKISSNDQEKFFNRGHENHVHKFWKKFLRVRFMVINFLRKSAGKCRGIFWKKISI